MPTAAWKGFIHSWHTLGIVLKWMCITVVGIPFAILTCIVVAAAVLAFAALCLAAAAGVCAGVFYLLKWTLWVLLRIPFWISEFRIHRAERRVFRLPTSQPRPMLQVRPNHRHGRPVATIIPVPPRAHIAPPALRGDAAGPVADLPGMVECPVCLEKKLPDEFPARQPTDNCDHPTRCCTPCLSRHITMSFEGKMWDNIRCPLCNLQLQHKDVAEFATQDIFERYALYRFLFLLLCTNPLRSYDNLSTRRALETRFPNFRWCLGPNCEYGEEHPDDPKQPMITCTSCGFDSCFFHNTTWHEGMTCDEYNAKIAAGAIKAEKKTEKIIKKIAKRCPGCQRFINKNGGCSHMSCKSLFQTLRV
jgi:IBR domain, a half RING-finger domain